MPNKGFYKNETFFTQKFKNLTICLDLNKNNENTLFTLPIYTSNTSKLLSLSLVYNKLDSSPSFCNDLSHNYHSYISNVTSQSLSLRFFDGNTYVFRTSNGKFVNDELDAEISNVGIIFYELKMPGYKSIKYITNGSVFILFQIESYEESLTFGYDSDGKITAIQSDAFNSESITFTYEQNHTYIDIYHLYYLYNYI